MVAAQPLEACTPLQNDATAVQGAIVLVQRGEGAGREPALLWCVWNGFNQCPAQIHSTCNSCSCLGAGTTLLQPARRHVRVQPEGAGGAGRGRCGCPHLRQRAAGLFHLGRRRCRGCAIGWWGWLVACAGLHSRSFCLLGKEDPASLHRVLLTPPPPHPPACSGIHHDPGYVGHAPHRPVLGGLW